MFNGVGLPDTITTTQVHGFENQGLCLRAINRTKQGLTNNRRSVDVVCVQTTGEMR